MLRMDDNHRICNQKNNKKTKTSSTRVIPLRSDLRSEREKFWIESTGSRCNLVHSRYCAAFRPRAGIPENYRQHGPASFTRAVP
jgi:hypothetical protein